MYKIGLDVGSTTIKYVVLDENDKVILKSYERHYSKIREKSKELLSEVMNSLPIKTARIAISGSAGMGMAQSSNVDFVQEVFATKIATTKLSPNTDVVIELGGEDAKILFLSGGLEVRMNGSCAGGTGAFIDQMSTLLNVSLDEMNEYAKNYENIYTVASRCGVFAKSDIQPIINQGASKNNISASIFHAVVNQTIAGLAQGREIKGNILYLGGPLTHMSELRRSFDTTLKLNGVCPENSLYYVAIGAALQAETELDIEETAEKLLNFTSEIAESNIPPLFNSQQEYDIFCQEHNKDTVNTGTLDGYDHPVYIGIDAGSTTLKYVVIGKDKELLYSKYQSNSGNPVPLIKEFLDYLYINYPDIKISSSCVTGYGEEIIKNAFLIDYGVVETVAHLTAAKKFRPDVDFIIDIGGQDIKCFKIRNGVIDNIFLNEACSSGCGSFLQTFASAWDYDIDKFAKIGLFAQNPVDLGSRCTVFMNSSVKQAQKDGATIENISAGLSISVVKNALYKVIRTPSADALGKNIVVQGGTFINDAVLRAFEQELGITAVRPDIAGLMGAYGAALYAIEKQKGSDSSNSTILSADDLKSFSHTVKAVSCALCNNHCKLTVNTFDNGRKFIGGNRCEKPVLHNAKVDSNGKKIISNRLGDDLNIYKYKLSLLEKYKPVEGPRGKIGLPLGLNMYELLPFWHTFFTHLGFEVIKSPYSTRKSYLKGQNTIPSDTVCFPAKLIHGSIVDLLEMGVETIFYPCMSYNINEKHGDNHYNCPVVAYYPEVISANMKVLNDKVFISDYVGIHNRSYFPKKIKNILDKYFDDIPLYDIKKATKLAFAEYKNYFNNVRNRGMEIIEKANAQNLHIIILAGRPYHIDPEVNHGIDNLILECGAAIISEDVISHFVKKIDTKVLNQWTYHSRLYASAKYIADYPNMNLVQLVSFGCGVDAITTDEIRDILEMGGKIYTQIKIDEITNLSAVKIRLRSLFAAVDK